MGLPSYILPIMGKTVFPNLYSNNFGGFNEYVTIPDTASNSPTNNCSWSFWIKGAAQSGSCIFSQWDFFFNRRKYLIRSAPVATSKVEVYLSSNGTTVGKQYIGSQTILDSTWHHVAVTFATSVLKIYVDGVEDAAVTKSIDLVCNSLYNSPDNHAIGVGNISSGAVYLTGKIAQPAIWDIELSSAQVSEVYNLVMGDYTALSFGANCVFAGYFPNGTADYPTLTDYAAGNDGTMINQEAADINTDIP